MLTFDGKPSAVTGPAVISGTMVAGKVTDPNTIEVTGSREGVVTGKSTWVLSTDGRTLTETTTRLAGGAPSVIVYQKQ
jgi:cytoskeletal protein CcmA (bactofilin family)